jgi:hypothetical protein
LSDNPLAMSHAVTVSDDRVRAIARVLRESGVARPFDFCTAGEGVLFPPRGAPGALDLFFFLTAHQFGFWILKDGRYERPMTARVDGVELKGSDYISRCATRAWSRRPGIFAPAAAAERTDAQWSDLFADDDGYNPLPMWEEHLEILHGYTAWFRERGLTPSGIVGASNTSAKPLAAFLQEMAAVPGYAEDPLRKKLMLLAVILENRPERFLRVTHPESFGPIIDYHLQRSALRIGLVRIEDAALREKLIRRGLVEAADEEGIRAATFEAMESLVARSGLSVAAADYFFFTNRTRCPEMTEPDCSACPLRDVCARDTRLFQPVLRTAFY